MSRLTLPRLAVTLGGLALVGLAGFILLTAPRAGSVAAVQGLTGDAVEGEAVFWAAGCASCHAAAGAAGADMLVLAGRRVFPPGFGPFNTPHHSPPPKAGQG